MKKINIIILLTALITISSVEAKTFKISTSAPDGSFWMKQMREGAKQIKKLTEGRVKFKFYPGGVMGSEEVVLKKIRIRQLQGAAVSNGVIQRYFSDSQIYTLPMLFRNYEEVDSVRAVYDEKIIQGLEKAGMVSFGLSEGGFAYAMSTRPIVETEDLIKHKVWTPTNNKQAEMTLRSFGISPIPLSIGDVLTGLQTNIIDTVAVSPIAAIALQWHTQVKYVTNIPLAYIYATLIISKDEFYKIKEQDQKIVRKIMATVFTNIDRQNRKDNKAAFLALSEQGLEIIEPEGNTIEKWNNRGKVAREEVKTEGQISKMAVDEVEKILNSLRSKEDRISAK